MKKYKMEDFVLDKTNIGKFEIAGFERQLYTHHLHGIIRNIQENNLLDDIITVIPNGNKYKIIDGQHRFQAFVYLIKEKGLKKMKIVLRILSAPEFQKNGKEAYLTLDSAKPLTIRDILKVYDDGNVRFFNKLSRFCNHYGSRKKLSYVGVLAGIYYGLSGVPNVNKRSIKGVLEKISDDAINKMDYILSNLLVVTGHNLDSILYRAIVFRNTSKMVFTFSELIEDQKLFQDMLYRFQGDSFINRNAGDRTGESYSLVFDYMCRIFEKMVGD